MNQIHFVAFATLALAFTCESSFARAQAHSNKPLALSGYSVSQAYDIKDDQQLDIDIPQITSLLYRIKKTSPRSRAEYAQYSRDLTWDQIVKKTDDYRFWVFKRRVTLKKITKRRLTGTDNDSEVKGVYVCECENEQGQSVIVLARAMPKKLQNFPNGENETTLNEPIDFEGFLFARAVESGESDAQSRTTPVFIADRISWFPDSTELCNEAHVVLAEAGADIGQLDYVRANNTRRLNEADSEAFYQVMAAVKKAPVPDGISKRLGFIDLMQNSKSNFGHAASIKGVVRRCNKVPVNNPDISVRLGISEYYEMIVFPDLDGKKVKITNKQGPDLDYGRFPITVCSAELPEGMSEKEIERQRVSFDGYFYRFWKYKADKTDAAGTTGQVSPLVMARRPKILAPPSSNLNLILLIFSSLVIATLGYVLWSHRLADRRRKTPGQKIIDSLPDQIDVSTIAE